MGGAPGGQGGQQGDAGAGVPGGNIGTKGTYKGTTLRVGSLGRWVALAQHADLNLIHRAALAADITMDERGHARSPGEAWHRPPRGDNWFLVGGKGTTLRYYNG